MQRCIPTISCAVAHNAHFRRVFRFVMYVTKSLLPVGLALSPVPTILWRCLYVAFLQPILLFIDYATPLA